MYILAFLFILQYCLPTSGQTPDATTSAPTTQAALVGDSSLSTNAPLELRFTTPPRTLPEIARLTAHLEEQLAALAPTTQPATSQPTTQPEGETAEQLDGWRLELWKSLHELRNQAQELERQVRALDALSQDSEVAKLTEYISEYKQKTADLQNLSIPDEISEEDVAESRAEYEQYNQTIDALSATLDQQESLLRDGFSAQRAKIQEDVRSLQARRDKLDSTLEVDLKAADSDDAREIIHLRRRVLAARAAGMESARVVVELKEKRTQQELEKNKLRRDALKPYVLALRHRMTTLSEERSRSRAERLRARLEMPGIAPRQKAFYRLELLKDEQLAELQRDYANAIRDRFPTSVLQTRSSTFQRDRRYWQEFQASISRRTSVEVLAAYHDAGSELQRAKAELARLQSLLDQSFTEDRAIGDRMRAALESFDALAADFRRETLDETDEATIRLTQQIGQFRIELRNAFEEMAKLEHEVIERLRQGIEVMDGCVGLWEEATSVLYWAHLITRGPTILDPKAFATVHRELDAVVKHDGAEAIVGVATAVTKRLEVVTLVDWLVFGIVALAILYVVAWLMRTCYRIRRDALSDFLTEGTADEALPVPGFGARLRYHAARVGIVVLPILVLPAMGSALVISMNIAGTAASFIHRAGLIAAGLALAFGAMNAAFKAPKPRFRLIPCSQRVARYYRRFGYTLAFLAGLLLAPSMLLASLNLAPTATEQLSTWFVFVSTLVAFIFLVRRETVLNVFPRSDRGRLAGVVTFLRAMHPFAVIAFVVLLAMHPMGFRAMAFYITVGMASTIAFVLAAVLCYKLFKEFVIWIVSRVAKLQDSYPTAEASATPATVESGSGIVAKEQAAGQQTGPVDVLPPLARACIGAMRWLLIALAVVLSLSSWGIRPYELKQILDLELWRHGDQSVTLWRIAGGILAIFVAVIFSRAVRQTLETRFYPTHPSIDRGAQAAINTLLHYAIVVIGFYIGLQTLNIDFGALAVLFGGLGLGIGLGLQPLIVNFISGLLMLFERHVKVGDQVMIGDKIGEVTRVSMRSTTVRTPDGIHLIIPNGDFINQKVENWTLDNRPIRGQVAVGVAYGADPKRVRELLLEIAFAEPKVLMDPPPDAHFVHFADSSLNFNLVCWFNNPAERWAGMLSMRYAILEKFRENGIEIPFPQRTLTFGSSSPLEVRVVPSAGPAGASQEAI